MRLALFSLLAAGGAALLGLAARPAVRWMAAPFGIGAGGLVEPETLGLDIRRASAFVLPEAAAAGLLSGRATAWRKDWASPCYDSADGSLRCLPAFYVLGAFHAGALDLWQRLSAHPHALFSLPADSPAGLTHFSEVHGWDKSFWRGCDFGSCPDKRGAGALGGVAAPPGVLASPRTALWGEASGGSFTYTFSHTHSLFHTPWEKNMSACWQAGARDERHAQCFGPALAAQREADAAVGAGTGHAFQIPWLMRAVHGDRVRCARVGGPACPVRFIAAQLRIFPSPSLGSSRCCGTPWSASAPPTGTGRRRAALGR